MNFELFNQEIEKKKLDIVNNNYGENYVLLLIQNLFSIQNIDFEAFEVKDINNIMESLEEVIAEENEDGEFLLDPFASYSRMSSLSHKISALGAVPKLRESSPFTFL